jgi:hypothetical protein
MLVLRLVVPQVVSQPTLKLMMASLLRRDAKISSRRIQTSRSI